MEKTPNRFTTDQENPNCELFPKPFRPWKSRGRRRPAKLAKVDIDLRLADVVASGRAIAMSYNAWVEKVLRLGLAALVAFSVTITGQRATAEDALSPIKGAHWFGRGWPANFWTTNLLLHADQDFAQIRENGFNTLVLVVPWLGFVDPVTGLIDERSFSMLDQLVNKAESAGLKIVMRIGYSWNAGYPDNERHVSALFSLGRDYHAWLGYLRELGRRYGPDQDVTLFFLTWEDFWPALQVASSGLSDRLAFARESGFQNFLRSRMSLDEASRRYSQTFADWNDVPAPERRHPSFELFLDFFKDRFINQFFRPAQPLVPRLSAEIRVDSDTIFNGRDAVKVYDWSDTWTLPGAEWITIYFNPYFGAENSGKAIAPATAARNLASMLAHVRNVLGTRKIFMDQFNPRDHTPGLGNDYIKDDDIPDFLKLSAPIISEYTNGYAIWFYRGYSHNGVLHPDFSGAFEGWSAADAEASVTLHIGGYVQFRLSRGAMQAAIPLEKPVTLCVAGYSDGGSALVTDAQTGQIYTTVVFAGAGRRCADINVPETSILRITAQKQPVTISSVNGSGFAQPGLFYDEDGEPASLLPAFQEFNRELWSAAQVALKPEPGNGLLYPDKWIGRRLTGEIGGGPPTRMVGLEIQTFLPDQWPQETPLLITVNGTKTRATCQHGWHTIIVPVVADSGKIHYDIEAPDAKAPTQIGVGVDVRPLACILKGLKAVAP